MVSVSPARPDQVSMWLVPAGLPPASDVRTPKRRPSGRGGKQVRQPPDPDAPAGADAPSVWTEGLTDFGQQAERGGDKAK